MTHLMRKKIFYFRATVEFGFQGSDSHIMWYLLNFAFHRHTRLMAKIRLGLSGPAFWNISLLKIKKLADIFSDYFQQTYMCHMLAE